MALDCGGGFWKVFTVEFGCKPRPTREEPLFCCVHPSEWHRAEGSLVEVSDNVTFLVELVNIVALFTNLICLLAHVHRPHTGCFVSVALE